MGQKIIKKQIKSPVALFTYNRPKHFAKTLKSLSRNILAPQTPLIIFVDGPKDDALESDKKNIEEIVNLANSYRFKFKKVSIHKREQNFGLAKNITLGISEVFTSYDTIIVVEDDLMLHRQFLTFMNLALATYQQNKSIYHISAHSDEYAQKQKFDAFLWTKMDCWGWGTWKDRWMVHQENQTRSRVPDNERLEFDIGGIFDFSHQIDENLKGNLNTWAVFWYQTIFNNRGLCLNTRVGFVKNFGLDGTGTHRVQGSDFGQRNFIYSRNLNLPLNLPVVKLEEIPKSKLRKFRSVAHRIIHKTFNDKFNF